MMLEVAADGAEIGVAVEELGERDDGGTLLVGHADRLEPVYQPRTVGERGRGFAPRAAGEQSQVAYKLTDQEISDAEKHFTYVLKAGSRKSRDLMAVIDGAMGDKKKGIAVSCPLRAKSEQPTDPPAIAGPAGDGSVEKLAVPLDSDKGGAAR